MKRILSILLVCALLTGLAGTLAVEDPDQMPGQQETPIWIDPVPTDPTEPADPVAPTLPTDPAVPTLPSDPTSAAEPASQPTTSDGFVTFYPSEKLIEIIKEYEGFSPTPFRDAGNWSIGYGLHGNLESLPSYLSEAEADGILRRDLNRRAATLNEYFRKVGFHATQGQFDALVDLTYNTGPSWIGKCRLATAIENGLENYSDVEIADFLGVFCHVDGTVLDQLLKRRLHDVSMFLYGDYTGKSAERFVVVRCNENGGYIERDISFYIKGEPYGELPTATKKGARLLGWKKSDGELLKETDIAEEDLKVKAVWYDSMYAPEDPTEPTVRTAPTEETKATEPAAVPTEPAPAAQEILFRDVSTTDWFCSYVSSLSADGVVNGYPDGTFRPQGSVTVAEALKLILLASGYDEQAPTGTHWASGYISFALAQGFLQESDSRKPDREITRLLVAQIAAAALNLPDDTTVSPFVDTVDGSVLALYSAGIVQGSYVNDIPVYKPQDSLTRAEVSAIVWRIRELVRLSAVLPEEDELPDEEYDLPPSTYDPLLFRREGKFLRYGDVQTLNGIDVSSHNGDIDWAAVAADGVDFVFIRVGFRGYGSEGTMNADTKFEQNIRGAQSVGLKVGVYFYSQAVTTSEALEEADFVLDAIRGYRIDYPVVFDWEFVNLRSARTFSLSRGMLTACTKAFCDRIEAAGYRSMTYFSKYIGTTRCYLADLLDYDFWYAQYADMPTLDCPWTIWQYSKTGKINGIEGYTDLNICFYDYALNIDYRPVTAAAAPGTPADSLPTLPAVPDQPTIPTQPATPDQPTSPIVVIPTP